MSEDKTIEERISDLEEFKEKSSLVVEIFFDEWAALKEAFCEEIGQALHKISEDSDRRVRERIEKAWGVKL